MNSLSNINLLMMDWWRILELNRNDQIKLTLKDRTEITGYIHNESEGDLPLKLPATLKYDVIVIRESNEEELSGQKDANDVPDWTVVYKHEVETLDIIRAETAIKTRKKK